MSVSGIFKRFFIVETVSVGKTYMITKRRRKVPVLWVSMELL